MLTLVNQLKKSFAQILADMNFKLTISPVNFAQKMENMSQISPLLWICDKIWPLFNKSVDLFINQYKN